MLARFLTSVAQAILTLLIASVLVFGVVSISGDPVSLMLGPVQSQEQREVLRERLGLDRPIHERYVSYIGSVATGNLGHSYSKSAPVATLIAQRLPRSIILAGVTLLFSALLAIPAGVYSAVYRGSLFDRASRFTSVLGMAVPAFWLGGLLLLVFSVRLGWFPVLTSGRLGSPHNWVLPAATLSAFLTAAMYRLLRSGMLDALDNEYVTLATIEGFPPRTVIWGHVVPNAFLSVLTFVGQYVGLLVTVAIVVEKVFAWPGMGLLGYEAIVQRDLPLIQGFVLVSTGLVVVFNLMVDTLYGFLDPRIRT